MEIYRKKLARAAFRIAREYSRIIQTTKYVLLYLYNVKIIFKTMKI